MFAIIFCASATILARGGYGALNITFELSGCKKDETFWSPLQRVVERSRSRHGSRVRFRWVKAPTSDELTHLSHTIADRVARHLERQGLLVRDAGNNYLTAKGVDADPDSPPAEPMNGRNWNASVATSPDPR